MRTKTVYRTMDVREAIALAAAKVEGIEVKQGPRTWGPPQYLYFVTQDDGDYIHQNKHTVFRVAVE